MSVTPAQRKVLEAAAVHPLGYAPPIHSNNGYGSRSRRRMMHRMLRAGLFVENAHREYEITDIGRLEVEAHKARRQGRSSDALYRENGY